MPMSSASSHVNFFGISVLLGNVVAIPCWNFHNNFARFRDLGLTAEARIQLQIGGHVEAVGFVVVHFGETLGAFLHPDVTGGTRAVAATGVIERDAEVQCDIENRLFFAVILIWQFAVLELHSLALGQKGNLHRIFAGSLFGGGAGALNFFVCHCLLLSSSVMPVSPGLQTRRLWSLRITG